MVLTPEMRLQTSSVSLLLPELIAVPGGLFVMGCSRGRDDEKPPHEVFVPPFRAASKPVSNAQYAAFVQLSGQPPPPFWHEAGFSTPEIPVTGVSWYDAESFCGWLSLQTGIAYRLATEAEREFAALGGLIGADWPWPPEHGFDEEIAHQESPHVPRQRCRNGYGLYCMADNVHEWCSDWYDPGYYASSPSDSPRGPASGRRRASRGGSWRHSVKFTRVTARSSLQPTYRYNDYGFRVYADA